MTLSALPALPTPAKPASSYGQTQNNIELSDDTASDSSPERLTAAVEEEFSSDSDGSYTPGAIPGGLATAEIPTLRMDDTIQPSIIPAANSGKRVKHAFALDSIAGVVRMLLCALTAVPMLHNDC